MKPTPRLHKKTQRGLNKPVRMFLLSFRLEHPVEGWLDVNTIAADFESAADHLIKRFGDFDENEMILEGMVPYRGCVMFHHGCSARIVSSTFSNFSSH